MVRGPVADYRVVDMGWVLAGALPGMVLADLGAEVVKVETQKVLDNMRQGRPIVGEKRDPEQNPMFHNVNRSKKSISVDLSQPQGRELIIELVRISDVVIENYSAGVLERLGLDYERLLRVRPDLVMLSIAAVDRRGPLRDLRAYAETITSLSGLDAMAGYPGVRPLGVRLAYGDVSAAMHAVTALLAALHWRRETGQGAHIHVSMVGSTLATLGQAFMEHQMTGRAIQPRANYDPAAAPYNNYPCREDDTWLAIAVRSDDEWRGMCAAMGNPPWTQKPEFRTLYGRLTHRNELDVHVAAWTREQDAGDAAATLQQHGVAAFPVMKAEDRFFDPHFQERGLYKEIEHPVLGVEPIFNLPWKMETPPQIRRRAPLLGEDNHYVFSQVLGLTPAQLQRLEQDKVLH
ncbi:MAG: CoA transferase [Chloroflexi bacterium]|nr:CoA transferase [Chloroflexota bacterium]